MLNNHYVSITFMKALGFELKKTTNSSDLIRTPYKPLIIIPNKKKLLSVSEKFKGEVNKEEIKFPVNLGERHPFDLAEAEALYKQFSLVHAVIDKYVDYIVGSGFFIKTDNDAARQIIDKFMLDNNFDSLLRAWVREALIKGTGYLEMSGAAEEEPTGYKILDAKWMYIKRDNLGNIEVINQIKLNQRGNRLGGIDLKDGVNEFKPHEVAILPINVVGDAVYGAGIISPNLKIIDDLLGLSRDMHTLTHRKANAPIHAKMGDKDHFPQPADVTSLGQDLTTLTKTTEFATDFLIDISVIDFGNISESFKIPLEYDRDMLVTGFQIPEVLLGKGNIAEGLAKEQGEGFRLRTQSLRTDIEKVIESVIFKRILTANGLDVHVEFEWGIESNKDKNEKITKISELLKNPLLDSRLRIMLEKELALLMGFDVKELETPEEEREEEENTPVPIIPGQNKRSEIINYSYSDVVMAEVS